MPNWCENNMTIRHDDPKMMEKALEAWNSGKFLQTLIPCPQPLLDTVSGSVGRIGDDPLVNHRVELHEAQMALNLKHFGYKNWYDWCVAEWGTKWDIGFDTAEDNHAEIEDGAIQVRFSSAWSPPVTAYERLSEMGFIITAYYYEPGMQFCGRWDDGADDCIRIPDTIDEAKKVIPLDIDDAMCIIETMQGWEEHSA